MKVELAAVLMATGLALAPIASHAADKYADRPPGFEKTEALLIDAGLQSKVKTELEKDKSLVASNIKIDVSKGAATLSGKARSKDEADKAATIARKVDGVKSVQNNIQVGR